MIDSVNPNQETDPRIREKLKDIPEQIDVVGPIVQRLIALGWELDQMMFGKKEWGVPKTPSSSNSREKGRKYDSFPVDIAIFDSPEKLGDYRALLFIVECKQESETAGLEQLDIYLGLEPHVKLGIWTNSADSSASAIFLFRDEKGKTHPQKRTVAALPTPGSKIDKDYRGLRGQDLIVPSEETLIKVLKDLLGRIVAQDPNATRREEQLDQLCNILLLKLDSDKKARMQPSKEVSFKPMASERSTGGMVKEAFKVFVDKFPDIFVDTKDKELRFADSTLAQCVDDLAPLNLVGIGPGAVSVAFQILRGAALKQEEGQYFTPQPVIEAAVRFVGINENDRILDPACGTGGFLVECLTQMRNQVENEGGDTAEISRWAQIAIHGIDKDAIAVKLTKAVMQILGDGSAHCARGDSVLTHKWEAEYPHLSVPFQNGRFTLIFTNPPFGAPLKIKRQEAVRAKLSIVEGVPDAGEIELGLAMFNRCHQLLADGGKLCIVLPETYFFSPSFKFVRDWCGRRFKPLAVINIPMDAFQGFCRAKTNLYVFEKIAEYTNVKGAGNRAKVQAEAIAAALRGDVVLLNPKTCGIYKSGGKRYKVNENGQRTVELDNEMLEHVLKYKQNGVLPPGGAYIKVDEASKNGILVPAYYDPRWDAEFDTLKAQLGCGEMTLGDMEKNELITVHGGHGSPGNDQRNGSVPYIKVSDIRSLRVNINPTNMVPLGLARKLWRGENSGLKPWDLITPNRASSNIGEFAILLPGEERVVLTKEMFVVRITDKGAALFDQFYLLWAFSLQPVRDQWRRVTLMQTNREDVGNRYKEIRLPYPNKKEWAEMRSKDFRVLFQAIASATETFQTAVRNMKLPFIGSVFSESAASFEEEDAALRRITRN